MVCGSRFKSFQSYPPNLFSLILQTPLPQPFTVVFASPAVVPVALLPVMVPPLMVAVPARTHTPPPLFPALLPLMVPPVIVNAPMLYTPPRVTALLSLMVPPVIVNVP